MLAVPGLTFPIHERGDTMRLELTATDERVYRERLEPFLPQDIIDVHTHIWLRSFIGSASLEQGNRRTVSWPDRVAEDNSIEDLLDTYRLLFPGKRVTPAVFGSPNLGVDLEATNAYVSCSAAAHALPGLLVSTPAWPAPELEQRVLDGRFSGLKPYLSFAPQGIPANEITIFDYLPHAHLEINAQLFADFQRRCAANAVNVSESNRDAFIVGYVDPRNTCHSLFLSIFPSRSPLLLLLPDRIRLRPLNFHRAGL